MGQEKEEVLKAGVGPASRAPLIALSILALLAGMWAGLIRIGWSWPPLLPALPMVHGPLMVSGFLGTLISLERAVALGRRWTYAAPVLAALGAVIGMAGWPGSSWAALLMTLGSVGLVGVFAVIVRRQPAAYTATMALGSIAWLVGNGLWLAGRPVFSVVPWWMGFLVLTIAGERLELARVLRLSAASRSAFQATVAIILAGLVVSTAVYGLGVRITGFGMLGLAVWLLRYDIARRTVRQRGLTRFIAASLLAGYVWLVVGGLLALADAGATAGPTYDAILHAVFLGFVFSMIFGHAPIIFPAVLKAPMVFLDRFYVHLGLLHLSLLLRLAGDLGGWPALRQWGGLLNAVALLLFLGNTLWSVRASRTGAQVRRERVEVRTAQ